MKTGILFLMVILLAAALEAVDGNFISDTELPIALEERVVNGQQAEQHEWPWQILLLLNGHLRCGGSLIRDDWVLTAAHCVVKIDPNNLTVVVGVHNRESKTNVQQKFRVKKIIVHEDYYSDKFLYYKNDVALLKLSSFAKISEKVRPIELPTSGDRIAVGTMCYVTGWGRESVTKGPAPTVLKEAQIRIGSHQDCHNFYKNIDKPIDQTAMICAGGQGKGGACFGDSGGPLTCNEDGQWTLRGVVGWGHETCHTIHHTVFARVSSFVHWIQDNIGKGDCGTLVCFNGGTTSCFQGIPYCVCLLGYGGYQCQLGECRAMSCYNGGTRYCSVGRPFCDCRSGYGGHQCQYSGTESTSKPTLPTGKTPIRALLQLIQRFKDLLNSIEKVIQAGVSKNGANEYKRQITSLLKNLEDRAESIPSSRDLLTMKVNVSNVRSRAHMLLRKINDVIIEKKWLAIHCIIG